MLKPLQHTQTIDIVVDLSSVVQQSEFLSAHYLSSLSISQLVTAGKKHSTQDKYSCI